ncbi:hypothetical protein EMCRGX_G016189 [Ephydatia muelleri]
MNTLLGEVAMLNDVLYARYRIALKFRKLQKSLLLEHHEIGEMQEALLSTGIQSMSRQSEVVQDQLRSCISELYSALRLLRPSLPVSQLKEAEECCTTWISMVFRCSPGCRIEAGTLKILLALFCGLKLADKAKYIFSVLTNANGGVDIDGIGYFCSATQLLASCHQEQLYLKFDTLADLFRDCLLFVRLADDIRDEEYEGGIRRPWLSAFEFTKLMTSTPEPRFLDWMSLWFKLAVCEKAVHPVRCAVCSQKPITSMRYQCTECHNFHMCQMCYLKGRVTGKHTQTHSIMEFQSYNSSQKGWHKLFSSSSSKGGQDCSLMADPQEPFLHTPKFSFATVRNDEADSGMPEQAKSYHPTMVRIGGGAERSENGKHSDTVANKRPTPVVNGNRIPVPEPTLGPRKLSSSLDSLLKTEENKPPPHTGKSIQVPQVVIIQDTSIPERRASVPHSTCVPNSIVTKRDHNKPLSEVNKRISLEVDQLLNELSESTQDLSSTLPAPRPAKNMFGGSLQHLKFENKPTVVTHVPVKSGNLDDLELQLHLMQAGFKQLANGGRATYNKSTPTNLDEITKVSASLPAQPSKLSSSNDSLEHFSPHQLAVDDLLVAGARISVAW